MSACACLAKSVAEDRSLDALRHYCPHARGGRDCALRIEGPTATAPAYLRDWRRGDPVAAKGLSLWRDNAGESVWLSPNEVLALGLTALMREAIHDQALAEAVGADLEAARSPDVRTSTASEPTVVSADEYFMGGTDTEDGMASDRVAPEAREARLTMDDVIAADHASGGRPTVAFTERSALPEDRPGFGGIAALDADKAQRARPGFLGDEHVAAVDAAVTEALFAPSGEVDGWRWWVVRDGGGDLLAYDNRPTVDAYWADPARAHRDPAPSSMRGSVPLALAIRAAAEADGPMDGRDLRGVVSTGGIRVRLGLGEGASDGEVEAALVGYRLGWLAARADDEDEDFDGIPDYARADGETICAFGTGAIVCGRFYRDHPIQYFAGGLGLRRLCDGRWVKL